MNADAERMDADNGFELQYLRLLLANPRACAAPLLG
jgi:hypothetical protein